MTDRSWRLAGGLVILGAAILAAAHWLTFPYFLDSAYHLAVIEGFRQAGGPVTHAFWEAAPAGRPHLYPPLFHLLFSPARGLGIPLLSLARFWCWISFPLLLLTAWLVFSRLGTKRQACLTVVSLAVPFTFFLATVNNGPATLALIFGLGLLPALSKNRPLAGGLLLGMAFWTHAGIPWLLTLSLLLFGFLEPSFRKTCWRIIGLGILIGSPWLIHLALHLGQLQFHPRGEDRFLEINGVMLGLGLIGCAQAWKKRGIHLFLAALALGFLPMAIGYRFRYFSGQGLFPWLLCAGLALDGIVEKMRRPWAVGVLLGALALATPTFIWNMASNPPTGRLAWADTTVSTLAGKPQAIPRVTAESLFGEKFLIPLVLSVQAATQPDELIFCNLPYLGGMLSALSGRAATNQMLRETAGRPLEQQIHSARLIVWLKGVPIGRYGLKRVGETEIADLYLNPFARERRRVTPAMVSWWVADLLILLGVGLVLWDLHGNG